MIVRIMAEDQYRLDDSQMKQIEQLDNAMEAALDSNDEAAFTKALNELITAIREHGQVVPDDEVVASDLIIPASDMTLAEAQARLHSPSNAAE